MTAAAAADADYRQADGPGLADGLTYRGRTQSIRAWARELGVGESAIRYRLKTGWSVAKTLATRVAPRFKRGH